MNVIVNGKNETLENGTTIVQLIDIKNLKPEKIVIELNQKIIDKENLEVELKENDTLEIISFVGGG